MPPSFGSQVELPPPGEIIVPYVQRKPMKKDGAGVATSDEDRAMKEALGLNTSDAGTKFRECASKGRVHARRHGHRGRPLEGQRRVRGRRYEQEGPLLLDR